MCYAFTDKEYNAKLRQAFLEDISGREWQEYCFAFLVHLMEENKSVLENLKNI